MKVPKWVTDISLIEVAGHKEKKLNLEQVLGKPPNDCLKYLEKMQVNRGAETILYVFSFWKLKTPLSAELKTNSPGRLFLTLQFI